ncbi:MAG TPA: cyclic pyranopterin monophosphate synthase MoaC [Candidatus Saccharicenans sp.]|jgi:cyclic pyranopterin phosphate synthase|nr:cyclic pyranopterin monophosphate synthase MoaC [Candidatus Saccharicenans sp.]HRD02109.1 cyclic pyranopterin monophosphate synthase MoaC [Candidatus Saccharicenans sp.]
MTRERKRRQENKSLNKSGIIKMVEVAEKPETLRQAEARGEVKVSAEVMRLITENRLPKGDVLTAARLAGIQAAKKTSELIPLCHPLRITSVEVEVNPRPGRNLVEVKSSVRAVDRTGVEMEALTAVAVACLTVYDMCKAFDKRMIIGEIHLVSKSGGKSGNFHF